MEIINIFYFAFVAPPALAFMSGDMGTVIFADPSFLYECCVKFLQCRYYPQMQRFYLFLLTDNIYRHVIMRPEHIKRPDCHVKSCTSRRYFFKATVCLRFIVDRKPWHQSDMQWPLAPGTDKTKPLRPLFHEMYDEEISGYWHVYSFTRSR